MTFFFEHSYGLVIHAMTSTLSFVPCYFRKIQKGLNIDFTEGLLHLEARSILASRNFSPDYHSPTHAGNLNVFGMEVVRSCSISLSPRSSFFWGFLLLTKRLVTESRTMESESPIRILRRPLLLRVVSSRGCRDREGGAEGKGGPDSRLRILTGGAGLTTASYGLCIHEKVAT